MTQSSLQTQCPKCETRFRVTDEQLGIAKGKVRCGNCMAVFNAIDHQVLPRSSKPQASTQSAPSESATAGIHATEEDFVFADNPEEDAADGPYAGTKLTFSEDELSDSFRTIEEYGGTSFQDAEDDPAHHDIDESWAEAILEDSQKPAPAPQNEDTPRQPEPTPPPEPSPAPFSEPDLKPEPAPDSAPKAAADSATPDYNDDFYESFDDEPRFDFDGQDDRLGEPMAATLPYDNLRREPVSVRGSSTGRLRTLIWTLVVLALAGILVAQVTWYQFDRLAAIPELRPFYEKGCELAGCELKPLVNVDAIQSRKLVVRTDPENRTQLVVDAVIINRAAFEQPFPAIALTFANLNGDVVAQSIFTPDEYLSGDGQDLDTMPKDTPVRITIDIRDPGKDAVNYNLIFRPHSP